MNVFNIDKGLVPVLMDQLDRPTITEEFDSFFIKKIPPVIE